VSPTVRVRAPATSANLGPGFDALALALDLHDEVIAGFARDAVVVEVRGEGAGELPTDDNHLVVRAMLAGFEALGLHPPGLRLTCTNRIPQARGLGSSSAAIVSGLLAARALVADGPRRLPDPELLRLASELEGHPDNVAACLHGGLTIAWQDGTGTHAVRLRPAAGVHLMIFVPEQRGLTAHARAALPAVVPHSDAAANAARAALLIHALTTAPELLFPATDDWLHQDYRAPDMPQSAALVSRLRSSGIPAVVSGAGPSVLALCASPDIAIGDEILVTPGWHHRAVEIDLSGAVATLNWRHAERDPVAAGGAS
jgi:homoserine kinase